MACLAPSAAARMIVQAVGLNMVVVDWSEGKDFSDRCNVLVEDWATPKGGGALKKKKG
jgi:hypothetical protein